MGVHEGHGECLGHPGGALSKIIPLSQVRAELVWAAGPAGLDVFQVSSQAWVFGNIPLKGGLRGGLEDSPER